jgi:hypothetical protein
MVELTRLTDSSAIMDDGEALRRRWNQDGVLFFRNVMDPKLIAWARDRFRDKLSEAGLIDPAIEAPVWTGEEPKTWRTCDALGTEVWHEIVKEPKLNAVLAHIFEGKPVWIPIVAHRASPPNWPVKQGQDIFAGRHQDGFFNQAIGFAVCWIPLRDVAMESGSFAVAPGMHNLGWLHDETRDDKRIAPGAIPYEAWRAEDYRVGDVLIFNDRVPHSGLPNPTNEIRMSIDVRAVPDWAPQPVHGSVASVHGHDVTIHTDAGEDVTVHVDDRTYIRDMNPFPRLPLNELGKIAYPGSRVLAMVREDGSTTVMRRNFY